jgi:hypothetical protein
VRRKLFNSAIPPTFIAFFEKTDFESKKDNIVIHNSIKPNIFLEYLKILVIEKNDVKEIEQNYFLKYDYLWKVMLYGNVFDFFLIKRLKENFDSLNKVIEGNDLKY